MILPENPMYGSRQFAGGYDAPTPDTQASGSWCRWSSSNPAGAAHRPHYLFAPAAPRRIIFRSTGKVKDRPANRWWWRNRFLET
ncbi:MAG: hypothetical protein IPI44_15010 [Sulfuritalea sp.]|nr:hypothetical protein [Sulfuritalea sp.]